MARGARKRAPGGGRRPQGKAAKGKNFSVRLDEELLEEIERVGEGRSRNQKIEELLKWAIKSRDGAQRRRYGKHNHGLGRAITRLAWSVELATGASPNQTSNTWRNDHFAAAAVYEAILLFLHRLMPPGFDPSAAPPDPPPRVKENAKFSGRNLPAAQAAFYQTPASVGAIAALSLFEQLQSYEFPSRPHPPNTKYAEEYFEFPDIAIDLGLKDQ